MKNNQSLDKFKSKLTLEAVIKAVLLGLSVGFCACGLIALVCWLAGFKDGVWVALGAGLGLGFISMPFFYFFLFRPTEIQLSRRVDAMGLQERAVTMLDYKEDNSYMAALQRDDAEQRIASADTKLLTAVIPFWIVLTLVCAFVFCVPFTVVGGLYGYGLVQSPLVPDDAFEQFVAVSYIAEDGGEILGETDQLLSSGEDATTVTAIAADGYVFTGWSDGNNNPERTDLKITEDMEITAWFEAMENGDGDGDGNVEMGNQGDEATDEPGDEGGEAEGGEGNGNGDKGNGEGTGSGGEEQGEGQGDGQGEGAGGKWSEGNKIINGEIFYRDYLDQYHAEALQELTSLDDLPDDVREFIEAYYESV